MTFERLVELAYIGALGSWVEANKKMQDEYNDLTIREEEIIWNEILEIKKIAEGIPSMKVRFNNV